MIRRRAGSARLQPLAGEPTKLNVDGTPVCIDSASATIRTATGARATYPADLAFGIADAVVGAIVGRGHTPAAFAVGGARLGAVVGSSGGRHTVDVVPNWPPR